MGGIRKGKPCSWPSHDISLAISLGTGETLRLLVGPKSIPLDVWLLPYSWPYPITSLRNYQVRGRKFHKEFTIGLLSCRKLYLEPCLSITLIPPVRADISPLFSFSFSFSSSFSLSSSFFSLAFFSSLTLGLVLCPKGSELNAGRLQGFFCLFGFLS